MSERLGEVREHLASVRELQGLVQAMRTLAAARLQQAQGALPGLRRYADVVAGALGDAVWLLPGAPAAPPSTGPPGLVLFCAQHGFTGAFNRQVLEAAGPGAGGRVLLVVGARGAAHASERGLGPAWTAPMATQVTGVPEAARRLAEELYRRIAAGALGAVELVFWRHGGGARAALERRGLLPLALEPFRALRRRAPPIVHLAPARLVERLVEEYVFAVLAQAAMESFGSENAARLATLQSAREAIERRLEELRGEERRLRQEQITEELLEIVTGGATAVQADPPPAGRG